MFGIFLELVCFADPGFVKSDLLVDAGHSFVASQQSSVANLSRKKFQFFFDSAVLREKISTIKSTFWYFLFNSLKVVCCWLVVDQSEVVNLVSTFKYFLDQDRVAFHLPLLCVNNAKLVRKSEICWQNKLKNVLFVV